MCYTVSNEFHAFPHDSLNMLDLTIFCQGPPKPDPTAHKLKAYVV